MQGEGQAAAGPFLSRAKPNNQLSLRQDLAPPRPPARPGSPLPPGNAVSASPGAVCPLYPSLVPTAQICGQILTRGPGTGHELEQRMPWKRCPRKDKRRGRSGPKEKGREREQGSPRAQGRRHLKTSLTKIKPKQYVLSWYPTNQIQPTHIFFALYFLKIRRIHIKIQIFSFSLKIGRLSHLGLTVPHSKTCLL